MNKDILEGKWKQLSGEIRKKWGELTDDDLDQAMGQKDILSANCRNVTVTLAKSQSGAGHLARKKQGRLLQLICRQLEWAGRDGKTTAGLPGL